MKIKQCPKCEEHLPEHLIVPNMDICYKCLLTDAVAVNLEKLKKQQGEDPNGNGNESS